MFALYGITWLYYCGKMGYFFHPYSSRGDEHDWLHTLGSFLVPVEFIMCNQICVSGSSALQHMTFRYLRIAISVFSTKLTLCNFCICSRLNCSRRARSKSYFHDFMDENMLDMLAFCTALVWVRTLRYMAAVLAHFITSIVMDYYSCAVHFTLLFDLSMILYSTIEIHIFLLALTSPLKVTV